ncbi:hypothetical protein [Lacrimispora sp.]|uniref:hypothetical protein n=1 Tax=Lacrimispora sp. TaxID=2719234 RepID=UPI002FDB909B
MIFYFKKSRKVFIIWSIILTVIGYTILPLLFKNGSNRLMAYVLVPVISVYLALYIGRLMGYKIFQESLLLLYQNMEVERFIVELESMMKARLSKKEKCLLIQHLSNGYIAAGDFHKAKSILMDYMPLAEMLGADMEFTSNIISAMIQNRETEQADIAISDLKQVVSHEKDKSKKMRLQKTLAYQQACLETIKGSKKYCDVLENDFISSKSILHKLNVSRCLLELYKADGYQEKQKNIKDYIKENGNQHYMVKKIT